VLFLHERSALTQIARTGEREFRVLGVSARARGGGVGAALVNACIERSCAEHARALVLWTQPTMHAAHRLYEKLGFVRDPSRDVPDARGFTRMVYVRTFGE
jgi:GNAT superfamily N-acetyltransferase